MNPSAPKAEPGIKFRWADSRATWQKAAESLTSLPAMREPRRAEVPVQCDEQLVVEFYSR